MRQEVLRGCSNVVLVVEEDVEEDGREGGGKGNDSVHEHGFLVVGVAEKVVTEVFGISAGTTGVELGVTHSFSF